jgi:glycosyl transferase family 25
MDLSILNEFFDKIYVITLPTSSRFERIKKRLEGLEYEIFEGLNAEIIDKNEYLELGSKLTRGQLGCTVSHVNLYKKIAQENYEKILILEDDCVFLENLQSLRTSLSQLPSNWKVVYLGWEPNPMYANYSQNLCKITQNNLIYVHGTHCFGITKDFAKQCLEENSNYHFTADGLLTHMILKFGVEMFAVVPKVSLPENIDSITVEMDKLFGM